MTVPKNPKRYQIFVGESCVVDQNTPITQRELQDVIQEYKAHIAGHVCTSVYERYNLRKGFSKAELKELSKFFWGEI